MSNLLSAADRSAILELVAAYSFRWDAAEADEFSQLFTEDTECNFYLNGESDPSTELRGRDIMVPKPSILIKNISPNLVSLLVSNLIECPQRRYFTKGRELV